jgi:hypothetical protein
VKIDTKIMGHDVSVKPADKTRAQELTEVNIISESTELFRKYKQGKRVFDDKIIDNEDWYRRQHWPLIRQGKNTTVDNNKPEPASAWLFNALANKHADAMDNFPEVNVLPREMDDEEEAKSLSSILPVIFERNEFEETYSDAWWGKLKNGLAVYGVFWNSTLENGLGDVDIKRVDPLNVAWEPGVTDIQKGQSFFVDALVDNDVLNAQYPQLKGKAGGILVDTPRYRFDDDVDITNKSQVVDRYKKVNGGGKTIVHLIKFTGNTLLYSSELDPTLKDTGIYEHGDYPYHFDVLFPEEGTPIGFGYVDVCKDPQMYIDKLDQIIIENALKSGKKRWFKKTNAGVNVEQFADWSKDFVDCDNLSEDSLREITVSPLDSFIIKHKEMKVDELKETSGNRDFNQGSSAGGVTAASAIAALQEAGSKGSRDMIKGSYRTFTKINLMAIELIRQFHDETRKFRVDNQNGGFDFVAHNNAKLKMQETPPIVPTAGAAPMAQPPEPSYRLPIFDIKIKAQKANPFSRAAQNELAKELYGAGVFNPQTAESALIMLEMMNFEGVDKVKEQIKANAQMFQQLQQAMMQIQQMGAAMSVMQGQPPLAPPQAGMPNG